jgi:hypothetical protein
VPEEPDNPGGRRPELDIEALRALGDLAALRVPRRTTTILPDDLRTTTMPAEARTTTLITGPDGAPKPGRYVVESRQVTEFEVLENGHVIVRRQELDEGEPRATDG